MPASAKGSARNIALRREISHRSPPGDMLRRVLAERDGGMIAVTLMSSDMGKLYAALAQGVDKRR